LETEADGQGLLRLDAGALRLPGAAVSITGFGLSLPLGAAPGPRPARLAANLRDRRREGRFAPLKLALEGARDGEALSLSGTIGPRDGSATLPLRIDADLAAQSGRLDLGPSRLSFRRGRLQPAALSPALALLEAVTGGVRLSASGQRDAGGKLASGLSLELDGLTASAGDMAFEGLSGRVALDSLAPLRMRRAQSFKARRLVAGIPLEAARWDLRLARAGRVLELRDFRASLAGGEIALESLDWDTAAREHAFEIEIRDVSLERLLSDWQIAGITGTGRISGRLPVRLGPAGAGLADGRLAAGGPGVVRVDWGPARERLVGSSQQMALVVEALEDFRYETLSVGVSQEPGGELQLAIGLSGANPAVLDGYPFQFNIALSGALDPILQAVREGGRIGGNLLQGGFGLGN
ncbi:MAG: YdbH domain-containing protein, partial [Pseudomonadota bacterium]